MSDFGGSPDPMIIQLRALLTHMQVNPATIRRMMHERPEAYVLQIELGIGLVDALIAQYPQLTLGADGKPWTGT